jgi:hypothetical protein
MRGVSFVPHSRAIECGSRHFLTRVEYHPAARFSSRISIRHFINQSFSVADLMRVAISANPLNSQTLGMGERPPQAQGELQGEPCYQATDHMQWEMVLECPANSPCGSMIG